MEKVIEQVTNNQGVVTNEKLQIALKELEIRLIKWLVGTGIAGILAIAGLLKFMLH